MWNLKTKLIETEDSSVVGGGGVGKISEVIKSYKCPLVRLVSSKDVTYRTVTTVKNTVLCI